MLERHDLARDESLATLGGRAQARALIRAAVAEWTSKRNGFKAAEALQAQSIPASVALKPTQLMNDEQLWARGFFQVLDREEVGAHPYPGPVVRLSRTPATFDRPAPLFGQHTRSILAARLGLAEAELDALDAAGVTSRVPAPQDWR
jgi:crotonobetainyl-CoA:carnitine CoA-transferase CaiB-like acyl-CoA transferase